MSDPAAEFRPVLGRVPRSGLAFLHAGSGAAVVLLHGWGASKELWWSTIKALEPFYSVYAFDWPGHGSPALETDADILDALVESTATTCDTLGLHQIVLVGHSLGGNIAARVAIERPELVARLVLVDAAIDSRYLSALSRLYVDPRWGEAAIRLNRRLSGPFARMGARVPHEHGGGVVWPWMRRARYMARVDTHVLHSFLAALHRGSIADRVDAITQPTLVVTGEHDPLVHPRQAYLLADAIPCARLAIIKGAYHTPMDERPADFYRALLTFLDETAKQSA